jgi:hypothetical protein
MAIGGFMRQVPATAASKDRHRLTTGQATLGRRRRRILAILSVVAAGVLTLSASPLAAATSPVARYRIQRLCGVPRPGAAVCTGMKLLPSSLTPAELRANAMRQARKAGPAINYETPMAGYLTPQSLHSAYALPAETAASGTQTIAVIDAFDDPTAEADLGVYDAEFGLPACTSANGCFHKLDEQGKSSPLPPVEGVWAGEISIDVQMAHAICEGCHVLLVEADSEEFSDLGTAVNTAVAAGATEISNSYAGPEEASYSTYASSYYNHPGVVITAASGDCGYLNEACGWKEVANFPADYGDVIAVGGTRLSDTRGTWKSSVWSDGGSGCSDLFAAPSWQSSLSEFAATGCGLGRSIADVSAIGDPGTGVDVYDSTPEGNGDPTGWGVWGGTSVASPIVAGEFALAGGAHGVAYPGATLYSHNGEGLYDVIAGSNGSCSGASSCEAETGYDGPSGVGSPLGMRAFASPGAPTSVQPPAITGVAEEGQTLSVTPGSWTNSPSSSTRQWELCKPAACTAIAGATGTSYTLPSSDIGTTLRIQETASNASGISAPSVSAPSATVSSDVPTITSFTPTSGITGSWVTITGTALAGASEVLLGKLAASVRADSATQLEANVPSGASAAKIEVITAAGNAKSAAKFTPTLSITGFAPSAGAPGTTVRIKGVGFNAGSTVSFDGVRATISHLSAKKLTVVAPSGAPTGPITVTNSSAPLGAVSSASSYSAG